MIVKDPVSRYSATKIDQLIKTEIDKDLVFSKYTVIDPSPTSPIFGNYLYSDTTDTGPKDFTLFPDVKLQGKQAFRIKVKNFF